MLRHYSVSNAMLGGWSEKQNCHEQDLPPFYTDVINLVRKFISPVRKFINPVRK
jgi:hypothetical protein